MKAVVENCKKELERSSERMKKYADQSHIEPPSFEPGNLVMLNGKNIKTRRPARKLDHKMYGRFEILDIISPRRYVFASPKHGRYTQSFMDPSLNHLSRVIGTLI
jgi:hypothetical protein